MSQVNRLLAALPHDTQQRLLSHGHRISFQARTTLCELGDPFEHAYFPLSGMASLLAATDDGETVEVAAVGADGMIGLPLLTGSAVAPYAVALPLAMEAFRIPASALSLEVTRTPILQHLLTQYVHTVVGQTVQMAVCYRFHTARQRVCRWLLAARHHGRTETIAITQDLLAQTLGVARTGITAIAVDLQDRRVVRCRHGRITILDVRGLEALSCGCYRTLRDLSLATMAVASR